MDIFIVFFLMLGALMVIHQHKLLVAVVGCSVVLLLFTIQHTLDEIMQHFAHESHLLLNLSILLPGFSLVAWYFEQSGFDKRMSKYITSGGTLLWVVFVLSIVLDNIAAALIGGVLLRACSREIPFSMLVGIIGAANLGGAGSFCGDTTTVMLFISGVSIGEIAQGFLPAICAQILLVAWATKHSDHTLVNLKGSSTPVLWRYFLPLLGIPGLAIGNIVFDQPGLGLLAGVGVGAIVGKTPINGRILLKSLPVTLFLVLLVATASMLPLHLLQDYISGLDRNILAILLGLLSPWFDNIPLTAVAIKMGDFDWGLLAFTVGYGGSAMWFGSSAGVALGDQFPEVHNTKKWITPFFVTTGIYLVASVVYILVFVGLYPTAHDIFIGLMAAIGITLGGILMSIICIGSYYMCARMFNWYFPGSGLFREWLREAKEEWY